MFSALCGAGPWLSLAACSLIVQSYVLHLPPTLLMPSWWLCVDLWVSVVCTCCPLQVVEIKVVFMETNMGDGSSHSSSSNSEGASTEAEERLPSVVSGGLMS